MRIAKTADDSIFDDYLEHANHRTLVDYASFMPIRNLLNIHLILVYPASPAARELHDFHRELRFLHTGVMRDFLLRDYQLTAVQKFCQPFNNGTKYNSSADTNYLIL